MQGKKDVTQASSNRLVIGLAAAAAFGLASTWWLHMAPTDGSASRPVAATSRADGPGAAGTNIPTAPGNDPALLKPITSGPLTPGVQAAGVDISTGALMAIRLQDADGKPRTLAEWQGKPIVINFWATWCNPCREEMPLLSRLAKAPANADAVVLGVALDNPESVHGFLTAHPTGYPILVDQDSVGENLASRLGDSSGALPFTAIVDRNGVVVETRLGPWKDGELDTRLAALRAR